MKPATIVLLLLFTGIINCSEASNGKNSACQIFKKYEELRRKLTAEVISSEASQKHEVATELFFNLEKQMRFLIESCKEQKNCKKPAELEQLLPKYFQAQLAFFESKKELDLFINNAKNMQEMVELLKKYSV